MSEEAYENVMGGKLSLKGFGGELKKKKKKKRKHEEVEKESNSNSTNELSSPKKAAAEVEARPISATGKTAAERKAEEKRRLRERERLEKAAKQSYRDKVKNLNEKLSTLSEHHDIPKVAAAGMG